MSERIHSDHRDPEMFVPFFRKFFKTVVFRLYFYAWFSRNRADRLESLEFLGRLGRPDPKSDQHQFSPNNIHTLLKEKVMGINIVIGNGKRLLFDIKFPQLPYLFD